MAGVGILVRGIIDAGLEDALDPQSALSSIGLGMIAMVRGDAAGAQQQLQSALVKDPPNIAARRLLAQLLERDRPGEALRLCEEIRQLAPETERNDDCIGRNAAR